MFNDMKMRLLESSSEMIETTADQFVEVVPQIVLALFVLIFGVIIAHALKKLVMRIFDFIGLDKLATKVSLHKALNTIGIRHSISNILGLLVYWLVILLALLLMSEALQLGTISEAIGAIVAYIPNLIGGLLILVIGLLVGRFFRDVVSTSLARAGIVASDILGHVVQAIIVIFVCLLALKQVGFDVSVITTNIAVILAVVLISTGLAIALSVRPVLESYFICRQLKMYIHKGDQVEFAEIKGEVIDISLAGVVIRHGDADVIIPARHFFEQRFQRKSS